MSKPISALYLSGNKTKLLDTILPYLKEEGRETLICPFTGTASIELACEDATMFESYYSNDISEHMIDLHERLKSPEFLLRVSAVNDKYPSTKEGYVKLKDAYNKGKCKDSVMLFNLMLRSHNNGIRFSGRGDKLKFNRPYGERNRFAMTRMLRHHTICRDFNFSNEGFAAFLTRMDKVVDWTKVVIYLDPPYTGTCASYNENGGWTPQEDQVLLEMVVELHNRGAKVVMSNIFYNRGYTAQYLIDFCKQHEDKFEVHHLNRDYRNSASFKYEGKKTDEVLIVSKMGE